MSQGIVLKNFVSIKKMYRGFVVYELIDHDGVEFAPFSIFQRDFIDNPDNRSASTIKVARTAVAKFLDYLSELNVFDGEYDPTYLRFVVNQYPEFLADVFEKQSGSAESDNDLLTT